MSYSRLALYSPPTKLETYIVNPSTVEYWTERDRLKFTLFSRDIDTYSTIQLQKLVGNTWEPCETFSKLEWAAKNYTVDYFWNDPINCYISYIFRFVYFRHSTPIKITDPITFTLEEAQASPRATIDFVVFSEGDFYPIDGNILVVSPFESISVYLRITRTPGSTDTIYASPTTSAPDSNLSLSFNNNTGYTLYNPVVTLTYDSEDLTHLIPCPVASSGSIGKASLTLGVNVSNNDQYSEVIELQFVEPEP